MLPVNVTCRGIVLIFRQAVLDPVVVRGGEDRHIERVYVGDGRGALTAACHLSM